MPAPTAEIASPTRSTTWNAVKAAVERRLDRAHTRGERERGTGAEGDRAEERDPQRGREAEQRDDHPDPEHADARASVGRRAAAGPASGP